MDELERELVGTLLVIAIQVLIGGTAVYFLRRRTELEPFWSWPKSVGSFALLVVIITLLSVIPNYGVVIAAAGSFAGFMRITGLRFLPSFFVLILMGISVFVISGFLSIIFEADLLTIEPKVY